MSEVLDLAPQERARAGSADAGPRLLGGADGAREGVAGASRERTLLLVDDEENILAALKRMLRRASIRVLTASSATEGLRLLAAQPVDVVVSDQRMPVMTGVEFLRRVKELHPDSVRMVLSGYTDLQSVTDAINEGAIYKFLTKPWDDDHLLANIEEAFRRKEVGDENRRLSAELEASNARLSMVNQELCNLLRDDAFIAERDQALLAALQETLHHLPVAIVGVDGEGLIAHSNRMADALIGRGVPLAGRRAGEVFPADLVQWLGVGGRSEFVVAGRCFTASARLVGGAAAGQRGAVLTLACGDDA